MCEINGLTIHQRAASHDAGYASPRALLRCRRRHTPLAKRPVEPDTPDVSGRGLPNDLLRDAGMRGDDQAIQITGYAGKVRITFYAFDFGSVRVDGKHFVTRVAQFAEHGVRGAISPARDTSDGDTLSAQKVRNERGQWPHRDVLGQIQPLRTFRSKGTGRTVLGATEMLHVQQFGRNTEKGEGSPSAGTGARCIVPLRIKEGDPGANCSSRRR